MAYRFISVYKQRKRAARSQKQKALPKYRRVYMKFSGLQMRGEPGNLRLAAGGKEEHLALEDHVCVADGWVCLSDAGPVGGVAKLDLSDCRQRVALLHGELRCGARRRNRRRQINLRAYYDVVGVTNRGIDREQFVPTEPFSQSLFRDFPERIARPNDHRVEFCRPLWYHRNDRCHGRDRRGSGRLRRRHSNGRRARRHHERWSREKNPWALERRALHRWLVRSKAWRSRLGNRRTQRHHRRFW